MSNLTNQIYSFLTEKNYICSIENFENDAPGVSNIVIKYQDEDQHELSILLVINENTSRLSFYTTILYFPEEYRDSMHQLCAIICREFKWVKVFVDIDTLSVVMLRNEVLRANSFTYDIYNILTLMIYTFNRSISPLEKIVFHKQ